MFSSYQVSNENKKFIFIDKIKQFGNNNYKELYEFKNRCNKQKHAK